MILWDIDGTLLSGGAVAREAFGDAVTQVTGVNARDHGVSMSGKTDPQIALEIMERVGVAHGDARSALPDVLLALEEGLAAQSARLTRQSCPKNAESATFSTSVRLRNGRGIWKVRPMPLWQIRFGGSPVMSAPSNVMVPPFGA